MKFKKQFLAAGTLAAIAAPIASVISCGGTTENNDKVVIKTTWASSGAQIKALQTVVEAYNKQKGKDDFEVVVKHVEGGYGKALDNDSKDIKLGHMSSVADAYIDYPDSVGKLENIRGKDYSLDLNKEAGVDLTKFDQRFVEKDAKSLPLALSTEMDSIDLPVLGKVIFELGDVKTKAIKGGIIEKALKAWDGGKAAADKAAINKIWKSSNLVDKYKSSISIDESTFTDYQKLFKFASAVEKAYKMNATSDTHVIGDDSPTNLAYILYASKNAPNKDIYTKTENTFLKNGSKFKEILKEIHDEVANGALILNGNGAYSSEDLIKHRMIFAIGSTAGYNHNFKGADSGKTELKATNNETITLGKYDKTLRLDGENLVTDDQYKNKVLTSGTKPYSVVVKPEDLTSIKALKEDAKFFQVQDIDSKLIDEINSSKDTKVISAKSYDSKGKAHNTHIIVINKDKVKVTSQSTNELNRDEIDFIPAPNTNGTKYKFALSQGPSFVGVKHGGKKDSELGKFLKWFYNPESRLQGDSSTSSSSVVDSFALQASYVIPKSGFETYEWDPNKNGGNYMTTQVFKNNDVLAYTNPVTKDSKIIRDQIESTLKDTLEAAFHQAKDSSKDVKSANDIYNDIKNRLSTGHQIK